MEAELAAAGDAVSEFSLGGNCGGLHELWRLSADGDTVRRHAGPDSMADATAASATAFGV